MTGVGGEVISISARHRLAVCQAWNESDNGWVGPKGFSLHTSLGHAYAYIQQTYRGRGDRVPSSYTRVAGAPYPVIVAERRYEELRATAVDVPGSNHLSPTCIWLPIALFSELPPDCRNEAGDFPPAFLGDVVASHWNQMFPVYGFDRQAALAEAF